MDAFSKGGIFSRHACQKTSLGGIVSIAILQFSILFLVVFPPVYCRAQGWAIAFEENFNGTAVDESRWWIYNGAGHDNHGERRPAAFSVSDDILVVTAQMVGGAIVSGGMMHSSAFKYGKFEFRARTDPDPGEATSGVILTWPSSGQWPADGENDIYETKSDADRIPLTTAIHYVNGSGGHAWALAEYDDVDASEWHTVAMEWTESSIKIFIDGTPRYTLADTAIIPDNPHRLCIQLDAVQNTMSGVVRMYVDWVKIYQWSDEVPVAAMDMQPTGSHGNAQNGRLPVHGPAALYDLRGRLLCAGYRTEDFGGCLFVKRLRE